MNNFSEYENKGKNENEIKNENENEEIEIEKLKKELKENISKKWFHLNKSEEYRIKEINLESELKKKCKHKNRIKEKDSGPYPETHILCLDCGLYL